MWISGRGTNPRDLDMRVACHGFDSQDLAAIVDPLRTIFDTFALYRTDVGAAIVLAQQQTTATQLTLLFEQAASVSTITLISASVLVW